MVASTKKTRNLDEQFRFQDDSFSGGVGGWISHLRFATGVADGEQYLLRLFKKTSTPLDEDLRSLIARGLRRVRRVLSSRRARDLLVEVQDVTEDDAEIAIVMLDPGSPISGSSQRTRSRQAKFLVSAERYVFWRNISRVAEGLALCHEAGIVHGAVGPHSIFSHSDEQEDYRLGGYESCIHIAEPDAAGSGQLLRSSLSVSFRQDWMDLGRTAASILGADKPEGGPSLLSIERRILDRLANPPQYQLFDGQVVLRELEEVTRELERAASSVEGELVLYPSGQAVRSDLPSLTSGTVAADDLEAVHRFVEEDLLSPGLRVSIGKSGIIRVITDLAIYSVRAADGRVGLIVEAAKRRPDDWSVYDSAPLPHRIRLTRNRASSDERIQKLGPAVKRWDEVGDQARTDNPQDSPIWYALLLLEAFTLLREQFRIYPAVVLKPASENEKGVVWISPAEDAELDRRRVLMGLAPVAEALRRELSKDDGRTEWTLSRVDTLAGERTRQPHLAYEGSGEVDGKRAYAFLTSDAITPEPVFFLRPRRDLGTEHAVRRRLQNIVAARTNVELLRSIDDPAQVGMDEALRDIASPGPAPAGMDQTKAIAWKSIVAGKSINVVVGPPGVGKTYLISHLVKSILALTTDARILISAQNHETLIHMEDELRKELPASSTIVVRVERSRQDEKESHLREASRELLRSVAGVGSAAVMVSQQRQIKYALKPTDDTEKAIADRVGRDTDNLLLRASDVTLATTSSHVIEEMIADGDQFDWVIVEEAARANGAELVGALLLGNRRIMIGDHNQLSPFGAAERQKFYDPVRAGELLRNAKEQLETISDLPAEVDAALDILTSDTLLLNDVLAIAARLEEPFRTIADREDERQRDSLRPSTIANILLEQSRMHPAIGELVSNTFYRGKLLSSERVKKRPLTVASQPGFPTSPIVILNLPALSTVKKPSFEEPVDRSQKNETEAIALIAALQKLAPHPVPGEPHPTLAILSPYQGQVTQLERLVRQAFDTRDGFLQGFASPRGNGKFVFTSDSFQGSEADVILGSLVRNNVLIGSRSLGFVRSPQRMNVLLSRARQKLVLATSLKFIEETVNGVDPDRLGGELGFLRTMASELTRLSQVEFDGVGPGATIFRVDEHGRLRS